MLSGPGGDNTGVNPYVTTETRSATGSEPS